MFWNLFQGIDFSLEEKNLTSKKQHLFTGLLHSGKEVILAQLNCLEWDFLNLFCLPGTEGMELNCKNICKVLVDLFSMQKSICIERDQKTTKIIVFATIFLLLLLLL